MKEKIRSVCKISYLRSRISNPFKSSKLRLREGKRVPRIGEIGCSSENELSSGIRDESYQMTKRCSDRGRRSPEWSLSWRRQVRFHHMWMQSHQTI